MREPIWIDERDALALHGKSLMRHGGSGGLRDLGLLQSALARPRQQLAYADSANPIGLAAAYASGIVQNHPFIDGNKRVGFLACVQFLELNGYVFSASEEQAAQAVLDLAAGAMDEEGFADFLRRNSAKVKKTR